MSAPGRPKGESRSAQHEGSLLNPSSALITEPNLHDPDGFYEALIDAHHDLTLAESHAMNARLILLLANHIGDVDVLRQAFDAARATIESIPTPAAAPLATAPLAADPSSR